MQPRFSLSCPALVVENLTVAAKHAVWNQLLEGWVLFHFRPRPITGVLRIQNHFQVAVNVAAKTLKVSDLMKDGRRDDKDVFNRHKKNSDLERC